MHSHILVADDEPNIVRLIQTNLERRGYRVETATNGAEALAIIKANRPDLLVTDVMMPEMDGFELFSYLRRDPSLMDLPVILLTAQPADRSLAEQAQEIERDLERDIGDWKASFKFEYFLPKPFDPEILLRIIERYLPPEGGTASGEK